MQNHHNAVVVESSTTEIIQMSQIISDIVNKVSVNVIVQVMFYRQ